MHFVLKERTVVINTILKKNGNTLLWENANLSFNETD